jgi:putative cardiolipin synthase
MNFDQRSHHLNTEIGLIIDSPELARQTAARFESSVVPANSYALALRGEPAGGSPKLIWRTREGGKDIVYETEPARSPWQRMKVEFLSLLSLDKEL